MTGRKFGVIVELSSLPPRRKSEFARNEEIIFGMSLNLRNGTLISPAGMTVDRDVMNRSVMGGMRNPHRIGAVVQLVEAVELHLDENNALRAAMILLEWILESSFSGVRAKFAKMAIKRLTRVLI